MCSILITNRKITDFNRVNYFLKFRGPDHTQVYEQQGITFVHNLLSISGDFTEQPFIDDNIVAMHNGEIYNYGQYQSDGYVIIPAYHQYGELFARHFDGEFAVALADFDKKQLVIATDVFRTKPLWYAIQGTEFGISTYRTPLLELGFDNPIKVPANSISVLDLQTLSFNQIGTVYDFSLNQHKTTFDDWTLAFENAIKKRTSKLRERVFIGLSSGYDSGAIACELYRQGVKFAAYTVGKNEPREIVNARVRGNHDYIETTPELVKICHDYLKLSVESYKYTISSSSSDYNEHNLDLHDDTGSKGLGIICAVAKSEGYKIYISGQGADEIFCDYGFQGRKIFPHSNFGGLYPADLSTIFPWNSFYGSSMESYLAKEEMVSGAYGIEGRYPFLDTQVVQEFLWLAAELKNSAYKSVLDNYLKSNNYSYVKNQKLGFNL